MAPDRENMKLLHVMLRVSDPEAVVKFYEEAFGFELVETKERDTFTLYFLRVPGQDVALELTYNHGEDEPYEKGAGFGHVAVRAPDGMTLQEAYDAAVAAGGEDYRPPAECPGNYGFVKDPEGYEVEILGH